MKTFRNLITHRKLAAFLTIGMLLRSVVAVGYMLDTNPADGGLFSIIICEGPAGINAITGLEIETQHHGNHHDHSGNGNGDKHDHASEDHQFSSCSFWSSSSQSLQADHSFIDIPDAPFFNDVVFYQHHSVPRFPSNTRFARAPPSLS